ncbi:MAG: ubiquitin-like small modifier protein 1 [Promethearchaeota archaeon]
MINKEKGDIRITVKFFAGLKEITHVREIKLYFRKGGLLFDLLEIIFKKYALRQIVLNENNELRKYINILINGRQIKFLDGFKSKLHDRDTVAIFPPIAGG